jgi:hypothetical protein
MINDFESIEKLSRLVCDLRAENERLRADRRERIATGCLAVMLSLPERYPTHSDAARIAVSYSDALIAELDKETAP